MKSTVIAADGWLSHLTATFWLGLPLVGAQLAQLAINTTDVVIVGRLGAVDLAGIVLSIQYFFPILYFGSGFSMAIIPFVTQAVGQGSHDLARSHVRMALWLSLAYAVLVLPLLLYCGPILTWIGQKPEVVAKAASYLRILGFGVFPALVFLILKSFLSALGRTQIIFAVNLVCVLFNAIAAYALTLGHFGLPAFGLPGAASVALVVEVMFAGGLMIYIARTPECRAYGLHRSLLAPEWSALSAVLRNGIPISLMILSEMGLFSLAAIMIGWIGTVQLAAHGVAMQLTAIVFMVPLGFSQAATVRVGIVAANGTTSQIRRAGTATLAVVAVLALINGSLLVFRAQWLAGVFVEETSANARDVIAAAVPLIMIAGGFHLFDSLQSVGAGLARGLNDTVFPMVIAIFSYWAIGFTGAYILAFPLRLGAIGIWIGCAAGLFCAAVLLILRFFTLATRHDRNETASTIGTMA